MTIEIREHRYHDGDQSFIGKLVFDNTLSRQRPVVLVAPAFGGLGPVEIERATDLAKLGYVALAVDYYGNGRRATSEQEAFAWMGELNADRPLLARRMQRVLQEAKGVPMADPNRVAVIGYCFGGKAVLDLARSGADFQAAGVFHGVYDPPPTACKSIKPSILVLHGWDDPLARPSDLTALASELSTSCEDWHVIGFGGTGHAFTNPNARSPEAGMAYSAKADQRSWQYLLTFLSERLQYI